MTQRIKTALVLAAILIPTLLIGGLPWQIALSALGSIAMYELINMYGLKFPSWPAVISVIAIIMMIFSNEVLLFLPDYMGISHIVTVAMVLLLACTVVFRGYNFVDAGFLMLGILYIGWATHGAVIIREQNLSLFILLLIVVISTDTGAYFIGRYFGRRPLAPKLSPKKTVEGAIGGTVVATVISAIYLMYSQFEYSYGSMLMISTILSVAGQFGDLIASSLKRNFQVKDSGFILPGHGGILDRFDSILFVMIMAAIFGIR